MLTRRHRGGGNFGTDGSMRTVKIKEITSNKSIDELSDSFRNEVQIDYVDLKENSYKSFMGNIGNGKFAIFLKRNNFSLLKPYAQGYLIDKNGSVIIKIRRSIMLSSIGHMFWIFVLVFCFVGLIDELVKYKHINTGLLFGVIFSIGFMIFILHLYREKVKDLDECIKKIFE